MAIVDPFDRFGPYFPFHCRKGLTGHVQRCCPESRDTDKIDQGNRRGFGTTLGFTEYSEDLRQGPIGGDVLFAIRMSACQQ